MALLFSSGICLILILLTPLSAAANAQQPGERTKLVFSLKEAVERTLAVSYRIKESRAGVDESRSKQMQANAARWAQLEANLFGGPSPELDLRSSSGTIDSDSETSDPVVNGVFGRAQIRLVQPLYTFGKISAFREAAARGVEVSEAAVDQKASEVALQVKQAYYGSLLAGDIRGFLQGLRDELGKSLKKTERRVEVGSPAATLSDVYQLRAFVARLDKGIADADEGFRLARDALRTGLQLEEGVEFELADKTLTPVKLDLKGVEDYIRTASEIRPEFVRLRNGIKAREALVQAAVADQYPVFYAALVADLAESTNRDRSQVPIVTDPLKHYQGGIVVGLNWHFDFGITKGKIDEAQAKYTKLLHKKGFAEIGIPLQVRKAYRELRTAQQNIKFTRKAYRNARRWLVASVANADLGIGEVRELTDAFVSYSRFRVDNFRAIYNQRIALANLAFATGEAVREFSVR